jgi:RNA polymerase sigma-70 factor (ECF subfamily)
MFSSNSDFFSKLYTRFRIPIYRYVRERTRNEAVAEELTQEIFLKVFRFQGGFEAGPSISAWLWTIAKNTLNDYFRANREVSEDRRVSAEEAPSPVQNAEALIVRKDLRRRLVLMP